MTSAPSGRGRISRWVAVVAVTLHAAAVVLQPIAIGGYLNGNPSGLDVHGANAFLVGGLALISLLLMVLATIRNRWGVRTVVPMLVVTVLDALQIVLGAVHQMAIHIPLGIALVLGAVMVAVQSWRRTLVRPERSAAPVSTGPTR